MRKFIVLATLAVLFVFLFLRRPEQVTEPTVDEAKTVTVEKTETNVIVNKPTEQVTVAPLPQSKPAVAKLRPSITQPNKKDPNEELVLPYVLDDGLAVVQGDIVLGQPDPEDQDTRGVAVMPHIRLWPSTRIAYHIQPSLPNPDRVREALAMFDGTAIQFVPYTNESNVLVFEPGQGICKSYVGWIGGKQPIWLPPNCSAHEIAHEILHALGFVHEQNRDDRDGFIVLHEDGIEEKYKANFEKLPNAFMKVTGLAPFDFESIMMYPDWMFAKNGRRTMESKIQGRQILPRETPSQSDLDRLNQAYGKIPNL